MTDFTETATALTETDVAYAAGILDGNGRLTCTGPSDRPPRAGIAVATADPAVPLFLRDRLGGHLTEQSGRFWWHLRGPELLGVFERIAPHLRVKHREGRAFLGVLDHLRDMPDAHDVTGRAQWLDLINDSVVDFRAERETHTDPVMVGLPAFRRGAPLPIAADIASAHAAYVAGILDSDGHLRSADRSGPLAVVVATRALVLVDCLQHIAGGSARRLAGDRTRPPSYVWSVHRHSDIEHLLEQLTPFLVGKRGEAHIVLNAIRRERRLRAIVRQRGAHASHELHLSRRAASARRRRGDRF